MGLVIADSTCLIGLDRIGRLELLPQLFPDIVAPPAVIAEFGHTPAWLTVQRVSNDDRVRHLSEILDSGEAEALALAVELAGSRVILDDKKARRVAHQLGVKVIGTVGVLLRAKRQGFIAYVKPLLDELLAADFRISDALYEEALRLAEEGNLG